MSGRWPIDVNESLQSVFDDPACPQALRQMLAGALSWQVRNETPVRKALASPRIAPRWVAALLALGAKVTTEGGEKPLAEADVAEAYMLQVDFDGVRLGEAHVARTPADEPIVAAIAAVKMDGGIVQETRVALIGVWSETVRLAEAAAQLVGGSLDVEHIQRMAQAVEQEVMPKGDFRGSEEYRRAMAGVVTRRALSSLQDLRGFEDKVVSGKPEGPIQEVAGNDEREPRRSIALTINGEEKTLVVGRAERLLDALRSAGYTSVKYGCGTGDCGACTVLLDGQPVHSCQMRAADAAGRKITTVEALISNLQSPPPTLHPIQQAFIDVGAIQCGYCTPAQILTALALLDRNPDPTEDEIREALSGVLCRCTGYVKIVQAVQRAAAVMRGEEVVPFEPVEATLASDESPAELLGEYYHIPGDGRHPRTPLVISPPEMAGLDVVGKGEPKVDAVKLAAGRPVFTDDVKLDGMLYGALLTSPHAHARITRIDASKARALPGVHAVLTHQDLPRVKHASGGQSYPQPPPFDQVCLDDKVRHVGDRVAVAAAETPELARRALRLIEVEYEVLPPVLDGEEAMQDGAPIIHDEPDTKGIYDAEHNIVYHIEAGVGPPPAPPDGGGEGGAWAKADHIFEGTYRTSQQQHAHIEPHVCITYWDEDGRLVVRTSTQVPFHVRRILAPLIGLPVKQIRVVKPRIGGGFGNKQEMILEDLCAHLTVATGRPVRMMYSRRQEFTSSRSRHLQVMHYKIGVTDEMEVVATELRLVGDTGAYGTHGLTVQMVAGQKALTLYNTPYAKFTCDVVYTNKPSPGAFRGYGAMQCFFGLETLMSEIADRMGWDVVAFKRKNWIKEGEVLLLSKALGEGREGYEQTIQSSGLDDCVRVGLEVVDWVNKRRKVRVDGSIRRGIGMAVMLHGSGVAGLDMGAATIKMNDDGSFNLLVGATDLGTGSDTILAQIAAEVLGVPLDDMIVYSSDTDFTPFDKGAYASSTTYISGEAVRKAALDVAGQIKAHAAQMLGMSPPCPSGTSPPQARGTEGGQDGWVLRDRKVIAPDGTALTLAQVALSSLHQQEQHQIIASASNMSYASPPPFAAQFVEVAVDIETGQVTVERMLMAVDAGRVINPITASGQVEGGLQQGVGFAHCEEMVYDEQGRIVNARFGPYHVYKCNEMPELEVIFVQTDEPTGPFGAKSVAEIPLDGVAPAMADAIHDATGVWIREVPFTPERVWRALRGVGWE
jgi:putative selenate reductase molybdopterin-binding subunit